MLETDPAGVDPTTGRRAKGSFERIQKRKRRGRNELAKARRFAELYNPAKLEWICSLGQRSGRQLTKSHVCRLVVVSNAQKRDGLARKCARHGWSVLRLEFEIQRIQPKRAYGGRQLNRPVSLVNGLAETARLTQRWIHWADLLASPDSDAVEIYRNLPRDLQKSLHAITAGMEKLHRQIQRRLNPETKMPRKRSRPRES